MKIVAHARTHTHEQQQKKKKKKTQQQHENGWQNPSCVGEATAKNKTDKQTEKNRTKRLTRLRDPFNTTASISRERKAALYRPRLCLAVVCHPNSVYIDTL
jgi:triosephosphate isomerase